MTVVTSIDDVLLCCVDGVTPCVNRHAAPSQRSFAEGDNQRAGIATATTFLIETAGIGAIHRVVRCKRIGIRPCRRTWNQERIAAEEAADGGVVEAGAGRGEGRRGAGG